MNVRDRPQITEDQRAKMAVAGINFSPASGSAPGTVQLQLSAEQPLVLSGNVEDTDMRRALTYIVESSERFDAGVLLDCMWTCKVETGVPQLVQSLIAESATNLNAR